MKIKPIPIILISLLAILCIYITIGLQQQLEITNYIYESSKIPEKFDGYKILQISDLHCETFGTSQEDLLASIFSCSPDIIVMTGDIVDEDHDDISSVEDLLKGLDFAFPIYYVTGNHELDSNAASQYQQLLDLFSQYQVVDLDDSSSVISIEDSRIYLHGRKYLSKYVVDYLQPADTSVFNILLYHGSDNFDAISNFQYDLVLSGHAHGGIVRLPFLGGVFGNSGNLFPKYDAGMFTVGNSTLISSRGLGKTIIPRFYNNPELVLITLKSL